MSVVGLRPPEWHLTRQGSQAELQLTGDWVAYETGVRSATDVDHIVNEAAGTTLRIDSTRLGRWDSALIAFLKMLRETIGTQRTRPIQIDESGLPEAAKRLLALACAGRSEPISVHAPAPTLATRVGEAFFRDSSEVAEVFALVGDAALRGAAVFVRRARTRGVDVLEQVREAGASALMIVAVVNGLVGAIIAFVGAIQLRRFGAGIYIADLVGIGMAREMSAIMTAVVMAGRTGGAYAAHLATMQGNEEIDALKAFGIPVFDFLVLPRIIALVAMMPLLYVYACAVGIFGGYVVSIATLDLTSAGFLEELRYAVAGKQFAIGLAKSIAFGALIALAGCHIGLRAGRSAADVGHAATTAVVVGIVGIIVIDAIFAVCTNALGI